MRRAASSSPLDAFCTTGTSPTDPPRRVSVRRHRHRSRPVDAVAASLALPAGHRLELGALPTPATVRYELVGPADAPLVVVLGGISADCHVASSRIDPRPGWWEAQVGDAGRPLDTGHIRVLSVDFLGGAAIEGAGAKAAATTAGWPPITTADQADLLATLLEEVDEERIALLVGASYGGMVGLRLAARHPGRVRRLLLVGAAHRPHPMATAWRSLQRRIVRLGLDTGRPDEALEIARGLAMTTYRSSLEFDERFALPRPPAGTAGSADSAVRFPVEEYLEARGRSFAARFEPRAFLRLSESIDLHAVDPADVRAAVTLVAVDTDVLVPPWLIEELAAGLAGPVTTTRLSSPRGHDAFLTDTGPVADILQRAVREVRR